MELNYLSSNKTIFCFRIYYKAVTFKSVRTGIRIDMQIGGIEWRALKQIQAIDLKKKYAFRKVE